MEVPVSPIAGAMFVVLFVTWVLKIVNWVWLKPKKLEMELRKQGLKGNSYRLLYGDLKELSSMRKEANSRPINLYDDIVPRILTFVNHNIKKHGKDSFMWFGMWPRVNIMDPEQIKDIFVKFVDFQKPSTNLNPLGKLLANGLASLEEEKWAKHRKIINPAFCGSKELL